MNIVIIVLAIVLVISLYFAVTEIYDASHIYRNKENSFMYAVEDGSYARMASMYHENMAADGKEKESYREYYGVAKYFEAAFFYEMYCEAGDTNRAQKYKGMMDAAVVDMGDFSFLQEDIDTKLGIE